MVLMVGVLYQKRALPKESQVVLLGDAEYDTTKMLAWIEKNTAGKGWRWRGRNYPISSSAT